MNIFTPSAYVKKISHNQIKTDKIVAAKNQKKEFLDSKSFALTRCPNKKHGKKIYAYKENGRVVAVSVSPINDNFRSQIEDGVWDIVNSLIQKNYFTLSSCEGHYFEGSIRFIIAIPNLEFAEQIKKLFSSLKYVTAEIRETSANINIDLSDPKKPKFSRMKVEDFGFEEEAEDINNMYMRSYKRYWFLRVYMYKNGIFWSLFQFIFKWFFESNCKKNTLDLINSDNFPVNPY
jgi:hypothetical protein